MTKTTSPRKPTRKPAPAAKKTAPKAATPKPAPKPAPKATPAKAVAAEPKPAKPPKTKLVRDSFTIPKGEYAVIEALKQRAAALASPVKKSELLRAGIKALAAMDDAAFLAAAKAVPPIKTGRPKGKKAQPASAA